MVEGRRRCDAKERRVGVGLPCSSRRGCHHGSVPFPATYVAVTSPSADELEAAALARLTGLEYFGARAKAASDPPPRDDERELVEERPTLGEGVEPEAVSRRIHEPQLDVVHGERGVHGVEFSIFLGNSQGVT